MDRLVQSVAQVLNFSGSCMHITAHTPTVLGVTALRIPLNEGLINIALNSTYWRVKVVEETGSTQNDLTKEVRDGLASNGKVLVAENQTSGRGRLDRNFFAPPRSALLFSIFIAPKRPSRDWTWLPLLAGQAMAQAINQVCNFNSYQVPLLKWPNDILLGGNKVGGILAEAISQIGVVIGLGINVDIKPEELPVPTATSLEIAGWTQCDRSSLLIAFLKCFSNCLDRWESGDSALLREYQDISATIGKEVRIELPDGSILESKAVTIDQNGALILASGVKVQAGDVIHVSGR